MQTDSPFINSTTMKITVDVPLLEVGIQLFVERKESNSIAVWWHLQGVENLAISTIILEKSYNQKDYFAFNLRTKGHDYNESQDVEKIEDTDPSMDQCESYRLLMCLENGVRFFSPPVLVPKMEEVHE